MCMKNDVLVKFDDFLMLSVNGVASLDDIKRSLTGGENLTHKKY